MGGWVSMEQVVREHRERETQALDWHPPADTGAIGIEEADMVLPTELVSGKHKVSLKVVRREPGNGYLWRPFCSCGWSPARRAWRLRPSAERSGERHIELVGSPRPRRTDD